MFTSFQSTLQSVVLHTYCSASTFPHFCGNLPFSLSVENSALVFQLQKKKFSREKKKTVQCEDFLQQNGS